MASSFFSSFLEDVSAALDSPPISPCGNEEERFHGFRRKEKNLRKFDERLLARAGERGEEGRQAASEGVREARKSASFPDVGAAEDA